MNTHQAGLIFRLAQTVQEEHRRRLSVPYPPASRKGEYPHRRSGNLGNSIAFRPDSAKAVMVTGSLRMAYLRRAFYGNILEIEMNRTSLADTIADVLVGTKVGRQATAAGVRWTHRPGYTYPVG